jgi:predicted amidohydrolase YtcJ
VHAISDRANALVLEAFEKAAHNGRATVPHRARAGRPQAGLARFKVGVVASINPPAASTTPLGGEAHQPAAGRVQLPLFTAAGCGGLRHRLVRGAARRAWASTRP